MIYLKNVLYLPINFLIIQIIYPVFKISKIFRQEDNMEIDIIRPTDNEESKLEYVIIFRFNNYDILRNGKSHQYEMKCYKKVES